jgi:hypothetical protein
MPRMVTLQIMNKHGSILAFVFTCLLSVCLSNYAVTADSDFECVLSSDRETYEVGQQPIFTVLITNKTSKETYLIGSLDGSTSDRRFPKCSFEVIDSDGKPVERAPELMCGNMNALRTEDFVAIAPGKSFDPFGKEFFTPYQFHAFPVQQPGIYTVRFSYSTISNQLSDYFGGPIVGGVKAAKLELQQLFNRIAHIQLKSNELKLTFNPKAKN